MLSSDSKLYFKDDGGTAHDLLSGGDLWNRSGTDTYLKNTGDKVGIGETSPDRKLHVKDSGSYLARMETSGFSNGKVDICIYNGDPHGHLTALRGSICFDPSGAHLWINNSGSFPGDTGDDWFGA